MLAFGTLLGTCGIVPSSMAMTFYAAPPLLYLGGAVVESDRAAWDEAMRRFNDGITGSANASAIGTLSGSINGGSNGNIDGNINGSITTVIFHQSGGGDSATARFIGNDIRHRRLKTAVYGRCSSACANMFLGGVERQFAVVHRRIGSIGSTSGQCPSRPGDNRGSSGRDTRLRDGSRHRHACLYGLVFNDCHLSAPPRLRRARCIISRISGRRNRVVSHD